MNYFKNENDKVFAYDDEQVEQGYGKDLISITEKEMQEITYVEPIINPKLKGDTYTLNGIDYKVSLTYRDQNGLIAVKTGFELGITKTIFAFENGTKMPLTPDTFLNFAFWFAKKRNAFFKG